MEFTLLIRDCRFESQSFAGDVTSAHALTTAPFKSVSIKTDFFYEQRYPNFVYL